MACQAPKLHAPERYREPAWFTSLLWQQMTKSERDLLSMEHYVQKSFFKTASLMANSCQAVAILGDGDEATAQVAYTYGRSLGLAFQVRCRSSFLRFAQPVHFAQSMLTQACLHSAEMYCDQRRNPFVAACLHFPIASLGFAVSH